MKRHHWMMIVLILLWAGAFSSSIRTLADILHRRECRQQHNVYDCEKIVTWRPVAQKEGE